MKNTLLKILVLCLSVCFMLCVFTACDETNTLPNEGGTNQEQNIDDNGGDDNFVSDHKHVYNETIINPTCTEQGYTLYKCSCGDEYKDNYTNAIEHEFTNYVYDNNATYDEDGTKTAYCNHGCGKTDTIIDAGTKLKNGIAFKTLSVDGNTAYGKIPNAQTTFDFLEEIEKKGDVTYKVSNNIAGTDIIESKTAEPVVGDNNYYVLVYVNNELDSKFTVTIRRREIYAVTFETNGGSAIETQQIEEDSFATYPNATIRTGYTFASWDYDFTKPITNSFSINASWSPNTNTAYKAEYYLQNLDDNNYTLTDTDNLTGTTDTTANVEIKPYNHFTHTVISQSKESGNINANGSSVLKVYYTRNKYTVTFDGAEGTLISGNNVQLIKYGGSAIAPVFKKDGYTFKAWNKDFTNINGVLTVSATWIPVIYSISYTLSQGTMPENRQTYTIEDSFSFNLPQESIYYDFSWSLQGEKLTGISKGTIGDIVIVGEWEHKNKVFNIENGTINSVTDYGISLNEIDIGLCFQDELTNIAQGAFSACVNLQKIIISENIQTIQYAAFNGCGSLKCMSLPFIGHSRGSSGKSALFGYIFGEEEYERASFILQSVGGYALSPYYDSHLGYWRTYGWRGDSFKGMSRLYPAYIPQGLEDIIVSATLISTGSFTNVKFKRLMLTDSVKTIEHYSFAGAKIEEIKIEYGLKSIGKEAFYQCSSLTTINIPDSVTDIAEGVFTGCSKLQYNEYDNAYYLGNESNSYSLLIKTKSEDVGTCIINEKTRLIYQYAFYNCSSLTSITVGENNANYSSREGILYNKDKTEIILVPKVINGAIILPNTLTSIGSAFYNRSSLTSVTIPDSIMSIDKNAFYNCSSLTSITIGNSVTSIESYAFFGCNSLTSIYYTGTASQWSQITGLGNLMSSSRMLYINNEPVTNVVLENITEIKPYAFYYCSGLKSITIPDSVTNIGNRAFYNCSLLESVTIPDGVTSIGEYAFSGCKSLMDISIPRGVTVLRLDTFAGCERLKSVELPDSVVTLERGVFYNNFALESIVLDNNIRSIGVYVFDGCSSLTGVYYDGTSEDWSKTSISSNNSSLTSATLYYYSETAPTESGNYWHYDENNNPVVW